MVNIERFVVAASLVVGAWSTGCAHRPAMTASQCAALLSERPDTHHAVGSVRLLCIESAGPILRIYLCANGDAVTCRKSASAAFHLLRARPEEYLRSDGDLGFVSALSPLSAGETREAYPPKSILEQVEAGGLTIIIAVEVSPTRTPRKADRVALRRDALERSLRASGLSATVSAEWSNVNVD